MKYDIYIDQGNIAVKLCHNMVQYILKYWNSTEMIMVDNKSDFNSQRQPFLSN